MQGGATVILSISTGLINTSQISDRALLDPRLSPSLAEAQLSHSWRPGKGRDKPDVCAPGEHVELVLQSRERNAKKKGKKKQPEKASSFVPRTLHLSQFS